MNIPAIVSSIVSIITEISNQLNPSTALDLRSRIIQAISEMSTELERQEREEAKIISKKSKKSTF